MPWVASISNLQSYILTDRGSLQQINRKVGADYV